MHSPKCLQILNIYTYLDIKCSDTQTANICTHTRTQKHTVTWQLQATNLKDAWESCWDPWLLGEMGTSFPTTWLLRLPHSYRRHQTLSHLDHHHHHHHHPDLRQSLRRWPHYCWAHSLVACWWNGWWWHRWGWRQLGSARLATGWRCWWPGWTAGGGPSGRPTGWPLSHGPQPACACSCGQWSDEYLRRKAALLCHDLTTENKSMTLLTGKNLICMQFILVKKKTFLSLWQFLPARLDCKHLKLLVLGEIWCFILENQTVLFYCNFHLKRLTANTYNIIHWKKWT